MTVSSTASTPILRLITGGLHSLWRWLCSPWLLFLGGGVGLTLALATRALPQLPGQLLDEPATAARWMQDMSANYGVWGNLWLALGLFDVLHSPLLHIAHDLHTRPCCPICRRNRRAGVNLHPSRRA